MMSKFPEVDRALMQRMQDRIKPALLNEPPVIAIWALIDLAYYFMRLPRMHSNRAAMARFLRQVADEVARI